MTSNEIPPEVTESAKRLADAVNIHVHAVLAEGAGREKPGYVAIRLDDGRSVDGTLYDSRAEATRFCGHVNGGGVFYVRVGRETMPEREAVIVLQQHRQAYKAGVVFSEQEIITPQLTELMNPFIPNTLRGLN